MLKVRPGPFGEVLDTFGSAAFAVCDHQAAHIYVDPANDALEGRVRELISNVAGVARVFAGGERSLIGLDHPRAGDLVALSRGDSWFAYPYWLDDRMAPDFARTVDIHRKPGYDPCELFFDPGRIWPEGRAIFQLARKKLGFRTLVDVIPLDARWCAEAMGWRRLIGRTSRCSSAMVAPRRERHDRDDRNAQSLVVGAGW